MVVNYTKEEYAKAYTELLEILKYVSKSSFEKIPKENIEMYEKLRDNNYKYQYNTSLEIDEQDISHLTTILIANIYIKYWASEEERKKIEENDKRELEQIENEKKAIYNPDDLFIKNRKMESKQNNTEIEEELSLTIVENKSILTKIIEKLKSIIKKSNK